MSEQMKSKQNFEKRNLGEEELEVEVNRIAGDKYGKITLTEVLAGGVVSDIYRAKVIALDGSEKMIVVKYTKPNIPAGGNFTYSDIEHAFSLAQPVHNLDVEIQGQLDTATPKIIEHFSEEHITLMEDFTAEGYKLLQFRLLEDETTSTQMFALGRTLAKLQKEFVSKLQGISSIEEARWQFEERFFELKALLYNGRVDIFNEIQDDFLGRNKEYSGLIWTDGDQKNFALTDQGEVLAFDFGRSIVCDPDFMPANLAGHLGLFVIAGYLMVDNIETMLNSFLQEMKRDIPEYVFSEQKIVNYFTASLLHRGLAMRWVDKRLADKIGEDSLKQASMHFGDEVFSPKKRVVTLTEAFSLLETIAQFAQGGQYKRPNINI